MKARFAASDFDGPAPRFAVCLLHGSEADLVEERAAELTRHVAGAGDDPFRVATLAADEHGRLAAEVAARSLTGGRRVVRVRDCGERLLPALMRLAVPAADGACVILQAGTLTKRSKLRGWAEEAGHVAAVACNPDDAAGRRAFVDATAAGLGLRLDRDTRELLAERLPPGRRGMAAEMEKLALLSADGALAVPDVYELLDGDAGATAQTAIDAALAGDAAAAAAAWERAVEAGTSGVGFVRTAGSELGRLAAIRTEVERGASARDALERQRIYPRDPRARAWSLAVRRWTAAAAVDALRLTHEAERACKSTGADERLVVARLLARLAARHGS